MQRERERVRREREGRCEAAVGTRDKKIVYKIIEAEAATDFIHALDEEAGQGSRGDRGWLIKNGATAQNPFST